MANLIKIAWTS